MRLPLILSSGCALVVVASVSAQGTSSTTAQARPNQTSYYPSPIYQMNDVGRALNLTPEQTTRLNQLTEQTQARFRDQYDKLSTIEERDRAARLADLNRQYNTTWMQGSRNIFNDTQMNRYQQLQLQYGGFNSLSDPDVQRRLNLTDEQRNSLRQSIDWSNQQMAELNRQAASDRDRALQAYRDYQRQYQDRFGKFLTPEQLKTWQQMTGESFMFQPSFAPPPR